MKDNRRCPVCNSLGCPAHDPVPCPVCGTDVGLDGASCFNGNCTNYGNSVHTERCEEQHREV